jgi:uncharacterized protein (DUF1800 family)
MKSFLWAGAGLNDEQAAAVLLDRFAYGACPGDIRKVAETGPGRWLEQQLAALEEEADLDRRLQQFPALRLSHQELFGRFPANTQITAHARRFFDLVPPADTPVDSAWLSRRLEKFRAEQGYRSQDIDLYQELAGQKIVRAAYARNQLAERLTDFWQNHLYVTSSNFRSRPWTLAYESEAIRPNALGNFRTLLGASARHPARVQATLGDARKATVSEADTTLGLAIAKLEREGRHATVQAVRRQLAKIDAEEDLLLQRRFWPESGPNPEFARVLLQQTLGEGGYSPDDLQETARVFTGWSTVPYGIDERWFAGGFADAGDAGFVQQGSFVFRADRHDAKAKRVLGTRFPAGGGVEEGERVLDLLATHPATARRVARALAIHVVGESPSEPLVQSMAATFRSSRGDIRAVVRRLVESSEFWSRAAAREKVKSPFEYAVSAIRAGEADVSDTKSLVARIAAMGQPLYAYLDSNGLPSAKEWIAGGGLTSRVRFALDLGEGRIGGVSLPVAAGAESLALHVAGPQFQMR